MPEREVSSFVAQKALEFLALPSIERCERGWEVKYEEGLKVKY